MKTHLIACMFLLALNSCAQDKQPGFIEVTGSAEMTVVPDELELEIVLAHPATSKKSAEELDKKMFDALDAHNIPRSALSFISVDNPYYWYYWWYEYRHYCNTKTYKLTLDCSKHDFSFINDIKPEYIRSMRITRSSHSQITTYRRQVKVEAMKAAKEKASDLLESIGQKAGKVFEVVEMPEQANNNYNSWYNRYDIQNLSCNSIVPQSISGNNNNSGDSYIPAIRLRFEIKAKFEIL